MNKQILILKDRKCNFKAAQVLGGSDKGDRPCPGKKVETYLVEDCQNPTGVEQVQDAIEKIMIENGHAERPRSSSSTERSEPESEMNTRLMKIYEDLTFQEARITMSKERQH